MSTFSDWLGSLPSNEALAPTPTGSVRGVAPWIGQNQVPAMWRAFAPYGQSLINQSALAKMRGVTAGISGGRREFERSLLAGYRGAGVNSLFAKSALAESRPQVGRQISEARGGIMAERADETFNLMAGIQNALGESYISERDLWLQLNQGSLARKTARKGQSSSLLASSFGPLATLLSDSGSSAVTK